MAQSRNRTLLITLLGFTGLLIATLLAPGDLRKDLQRLALNLGLCGLGFLFWLVFFSQFLVPATGLRPRLQILMRFLDFISGLHGPALLIENGQIRQRKDIAERKGPGVLLLDTASAALLRTDQKFTRAVGPGLVFTTPSERLAETVDLRIQTQTIGPRPEENPFAPRQPQESEAQFEARQRRGKETLARTRDGFDVAPRIRVLFKIAAQPGEGNTEFGYNPQAVENAVLGQTINADLPLETPERLVRWNELPARLAAEVWRDLVSRFTLDELFPMGSNATQPSALQKISQEIRERLTKERIRGTDLYGNPSDSEIISREFNLLKSRGIHVLDVQIDDIKIRENVEKHLVTRWKAGWLNQARQEREWIELRRTQEVQKAKTEALQIYAEESTMEFASDQSTTQDPPASPQASHLKSRVLTKLLRGHLTLIQRRPRLQKILAEEVEQIRSLLEMLEAGVSKDEESS